MDINFFAKWSSFFCFAVAAAIHFYFFILESYLYQKADGYKYFKVNPQDHKATLIWAFNQGLYNLFLSVQMTIGLVFVRTGEPRLAGIIVGLSGIFMIIAGIALFVSAKHLRKGALVQLVPPTVGFLLLSLHIIR